MSHAHPLPYQQLRHRLHLALGLNAVVILAEFGAGLWINSTGLMSDAGHNLIDQGSLFLALYAHMLSSRPATATARSVIIGLAWSQRSSTPWSSS